jgi:putative toxin-antitoxin system antitoxin component (TIGR02293 family)
MDMKEFKMPNENQNVVNESIASYILAPSSNTTNLINYARQGISMSFLLNLSEKLSLSLQEVGNILHVSLRTLQRYAPTKTLDTDASAKVLNLEALHRHGIEVFGDEGSFNNWLRSKVPSLGNQTPLSYLDTPFGFQLVDQTLGRIEHGIFA